jgi:hypothetical protein
METKELLINLEAVRKRYEGKQVGCGEVRIDYLAGDCIPKIVELTDRLDAAEAKLNQIREALGEMSCGSYTSKLEMEVFLEWLMDILRGEQG